MTVAWAVLSGIVSLAPFFGLDTEVPLITKWLSAGCIFFASIAAGLLVQVRSLYMRARTPLCIRTVVLGEHFYQGMIIMILDRSTWVEPDQLLTLVELADGVQTPIALLRVSTFTTENFPQCIVEKSLTNKSLGNFLLDKGRWKSLTVFPDLKAHYLQGVSHD